MKKLENGCHFTETHHTEINDPPPLKFGSLLFQVSTEFMKFFFLAIMKKWKNGCISWKIMAQTFPINNPHPQSLVLHFSECQQKWKILNIHYEKW